MASITKRNNSYKIVVSCGRDSNNKQIRVMETYVPKATTPKAIEKEVKQYAMEFEQKVLNGQYKSGERIKFSEFVEDWDNNWASDTDNITPSIREGYLSILNRRFVPEFGNMYMTDIKPLHIQSIYKAMKEEGRAPGTIKRAHSVLNSVMKYAYRMDVIKDNPCDRIELPKMKKDNALHYFDLEQAKRFLSALEMEYTYSYKEHKRVLASTGKEYTVPKHTQTYHIPKQYQSYFCLAIYGGFRRGELVGLTWENVNFDEQTISIVQAMAKSKGTTYIKAPKTESSIREIKMPKQCFVKLKEWKREQQKLSFTLGTAWKGYRGKEYDKNYVFINEEGSAMHLDTPSHKFKEIVFAYNDRCKKEEEKLPIIRLHDLRHTSATLLLAENVDIETVSHRLGHSKASVTLDIYGHALEEKDVTASNKLAELFG